MLLLVYCYKCKRLEDARVYPIAGLSRVGSRRSCPAGLVCEPEEGGTLCLRGFFSVYSNYGTELSQTLLLSVGIRFLLRSREDRCRRAGCRDRRQCRRRWLLRRQRRAE